MTSIITNPRERTRFLRFAFVGAIGAVVDFGTFNALTNLFNFKPVFASVISFTAAVTSNFFWNRFWTYPDSRSKPMIRQMVEFGLINVLGLAIRTPLFAFLAKLLPEFYTSIRLPSIIPFDSRFLGHNTALAVAVIVVMFWNFFVNRYFTYNDVK